MAKRYRKNTLRIPHNHDSVGNFPTEDFELPFADDSKSEKTSVNNPYWNREEEPTATTFTDIEEGNQDYSVDTWPRFASNMLQGQIGIKPNTVFLLITLCWFLIISWLLIQDNQAGFLQSLEGIRQFGFKALISFVIYIVASIIFLINNLIVSKKRNIKK